MVGLVILVVSLILFDCFRTGRTWRTWSSQMILWLVSWRQDILIRKSQNTLSISAILPTLFSLRFQHSHPLRGVFRRSSTNNSALPQPSLVHSLHRLLLRRAQRRLHSSPTTTSHLLHDSLRRQTRRLLSPRFEPHPLRTPSSSILQLYSCDRSRGCSVQSWDEPYRPANGA